MRIVGGTCKRRLIKVPKRGLRPTKGIVRGAIFNIIGDKIIDTEVLDIFAGSGALGIEAISRGAKHCTSIEKDPQTLRINISNLSLNKQVTILAQDFRHALRKLRGRKFDIIFADPPYNRKFAQHTIDVIKRYSLLKSNGMMIIEHSPREKIPVPDTFQLLKRSKYGDTVVSFIIHREH